TIDASRQSPSTKFARSGRVLRYCSRSSARRLKMRVEEKIAIWRSQASYEVRDIDLVSHMHVEPLRSHTGHEVSLLLRGLGVGLQGLVLTVVPTECGNWMKNAALL